MANAVLIDPHTLRELQRIASATEVQNRIAAEVRDQLEGIRKELKAIRIQAQGAAAEYVGRSGG